MRHLRLHCEWSSALPIGNGRLGAMVYGRTTTEIFQLNEDSVWYGGPQDRTPKDAHRHLPRLRQLIHDHDHEAVHALVRDQFFTSPASMRHYEPLGSCTLEFNHQEADITDYSRHLDLATSQTVVQYRHKGISCRRDIIVSKPDGVLIVRISASAPLHFVIRLDRTGEDETETNSYLDFIYARAGEEARIVLHATPGGSGSNRLCMVLGVALDNQDDGSHIETGNRCLDCDFEVVHHCDCRADHISPCRPRGGSFSPSEPSLAAFLGCPAPQTPRRLCSTVWPDEPPYVAGCTSHSHE